MFVLLLLLVLVLVLLLLLLPLQAVYSDEVLRLVSQATPVSPVRTLGGLNNTWTHYEQVGWRLLLSAAVLGFFCLYLCSGYHGTSVQTASAVSGAEPLCIPAGIVLLLFAGCCWCAAACLAYADPLFLLFAAAANLLLLLLVFMPCAGAAS
jgi:hypothetical protein